MTLEEAKEILRKEGFYIKTNPDGSVLDEMVFHPFEKSSVKKAIKVLFDNGLIAYMSSINFIDRCIRLTNEGIKKNKSGINGAEHCGEPVSGTPLNATEALKEKHKDNKTTAKNPALKESASQFNDGLLDEQAKKIKRLEDYVASRNKIIAEQSAKISSLNAKITKKNKVISKKSRVVKDKDAVLADVAEELRLSKVREEKLTEVCQKYLKEIGELKDKVDYAERRMNDAYASCHEMKKKIDARDARIKELAEKLAKITVNNVDAQALKSAESALAYKENEMKKLQDAFDYKSRLNEEKKHTILKLKDVIAEKDDDIKVLKLQLSAWEKGNKGIDWKRNAEAIKLYVCRASQDRLWHSIDQDVCNEKELSFIVKHDGKRVKHALRFEGNDVIYECSDPDKKPSSEISQEELMKMQEEVVKKCTMPPLSPIQKLINGSGNGILDKMNVKVDLGKGESKTGVHILFPTEDNPEEIKIKDALKIIKKAMKDGKTVIIESEPKPIVTCAYTPEDFFKLMVKNNNSTL